MRRSRPDGEARNRTGDTTIFSRVLYQLSYLAEARGMLAGIGAVVSYRPPREHRHGDGPPRLSVPDSVWRRILAEPQRAPELIALAASERFAEPAERWATQVGPGHGQDAAALAEVAFKKHVRLSRLEGGALGFGGIVTAAPNLAGLMWIQARMVFFIAAAHGYDPRHPMRPAELLSLWLVCTKRRRPPGSRSTASASRWRSPS